MNEEIRKNLLANVIVPGVVSVVGVIAGAIYLYAFVL